MFWCHNISCVGYINNWLFWYTISKTNCPIFFTIRTGKPGPRNTTKRCYWGGTPLAPTTEEEPSATPLQIEVAIEGSAFNPAILPPPPPAPSSLPPNAPAPAPAPNLPVGAIVVWYNNDSVNHTVTARNNSFDNSNLSPGEPGDTFRYTFEQSGTFEYYCKIHPSMVGKIIIE
jgi:hypothetical protein